MGVESAVSQLQMQMLSAANTCAHAAASAESLKANGSSMRHHLAIFIGTPVLTPAFHAPFTCNGTRVILHHRRQTLLPLHHHHTALVSHKSHCKPNAFSPRTHKPYPKHTQLHHC
jgi:hypothetical protein